MNQVRRSRDVSCGVVLLALFQAMSGCGGQDSPRAEIDTVSLIINADDVGGHQNFSDASLEARLAGKVSSLSILSPAEDAGRAISLLKGHPELDVGIHLTLMGGGKPLTPREMAPSIYNEHGEMWATAEEVARHVRPQEAKIEWEAQIRRVLDAGIHVSHLDGHMGCYFVSRELFLAALDLAKQFQVPIIAPNTHEYIPPEDRDLFLVSSYVGIYRLEGAQETLANRTQAYRWMLGGLSPGIHYIWTHLGRPTPDRELFGDLDLRINDYDFWTSDAATRLLGDLGYRMIGCSALETQFRDALRSRRR